MIIPGKFARPFEKINRRSITACYVSNEDTLYNGKADMSSCYVRGQIATVA